MIRYNTSYRSRSAEETLQIARLWAEKLGISRVTDTTRLDRIGIPVYASIRPNAVEGSLCVNAGKGLQPLEAQVGAYMESIEFAMSEERNSALQAITGTSRDVLDGRQRTDAILDLCPLLDREIDLDAPLEIVQVMDITSGTPAIVPAELIFVPFESRIGTPQLFGDHSNGLASGNDVAEATVHAIMEIVERDILSFQYVKDQSIKLSHEGLPESAQMLLDKFKGAGLCWVIHSTPNLYGFGFFRCILWDPENPDPLYLNSGYGCHFDQEVALARAITEAAQSRLSFIHGGRDDLIDAWNSTRGLTPAEMQAQQNSIAALYQNTPSNLHWSQLKSRHMQFETANELLGLLIRDLQEHGMGKLLVGTHTRPNDPLQVVKVIIPSMEFFTPGTPRVGKRLTAYAEQTAHAALRGA